MVKIKILPGTEKVDLDFEHLNGRSTLSYAVFGGDIHTVKLFLLTGKLGDNPENPSGGTVSITYGHR